MATSIPIACSLDQTQLSDRRADVVDLGRALTAVQVEGAQARLRFRAQRRDEVERFVEAESSCCPFFDFRVIAGVDGVELRVEVPKDGEWAVRGLVAGFVAGWEGLV
jgi:hypothetical protein